MKVINIKELFRRGWAVGLILIALFGCGKPSEEACEPVPAPPGSKVVNQVTRTRVGMVGNADPNADWCRTCVKGPKGWISCQAEYAKTKDVNRDQLKSASRQKACDDAGFEKNSCPATAVVAVDCKDDAPRVSPEEASKALQKIFNQSKVQVMQGAAGTSPSPATPATQPSAAPKQ